MRAQLGPVAAPCCPYVGFPKLQCRVLKEQPAEWPRKEKAWESGQGFTLHLDDQAARMWHVEGLERFFSRSGPRAMYGQF